MPLFSLLHCSLSHPLSHLISMPGNPSLLVRLDFEKDFLCYSISSFNPHNPNEKFNIVLNAVDRRFAEFGWLHFSLIY